MFTILFLVIYYINRSNNYSSYFINKIMIRNQEVDTLENNLGYRKFKKLKKTRYFSKNRTNTYMLFELLIIIFTGLIIDMLLTDLVIKIITNADVNFITVIVSKLGFDFTLSYRYASLYVTIGIVSLIILLFIIISIEYTTLYDKIELYITNMFEDITGLSLEDKTKRKHIKNVFSKEHLDFKGNIIYKDGELIDRIHEAMEKNGKEYSRKEVIKAVKYSKKEVYYLEMLIRYKIDYTNLSYISKEDYKTNLEAIDKDIDTIINMFTYVRNNERITIEEDYKRIYKQDELAEDLDNFTNIRDRIDKYSKEGIRDKFTYNKAITLELISRLN